MASIERMRTLNQYCTNLCSCFNILNENKTTAFLAIFDELSSLFKYIYRKFQGDILVGSLLKKQITIGHFETL